MTDLNLISNKATLEGYAIHRLEAYRKEVELLQEQIREQQELLDEQGEVLQILDRHIQVTDEKYYITMGFIPVESYEAEKVAKCFGITLPKKEAKDEPES